MAEEAHAIIAAIGIPFHHVRPAVECRRGEALLVDIGDAAHHPAISDAEQMEIGGIAPEGIEQRHRIERRSIMVDLPLDARIFAAVEKIPIAPRIAVIAPARDRRIVSEDHLTRGIRLRLPAEMAHPGVDFRLPGRIPRHFRAEGIFERAPVIGARLHQPLHFGRLVGQPLALQVGEDVDEHIALHQPELGIMRCIAHHRDDRLIGMIEIPAPIVAGDQPGMVARDAIQHPMADRDMRIIIGAPDIAGVLLVPRRP